MGPTADQVAAQQQPADRQLADLAAGQTAGGDVGLGLLRLLGGGLRGPALRRGPEDVLLDTAVRCADPHCSGNAAGQKTPSICLVCHGWLPVYVKFLHWYFSNPSRGESQAAANPATNRFD